MPQSTLGGPPACNEERDCHVPIESDLATTNERKRRAEALLFLFMLKKPTIVFINPARYVDGLQFGQ
jgi:hypothetical protein